MNIKFYTPSYHTTRPAGYTSASSNFVCPGIDPRQEFVEVPPSVAEIRKLYSEVRLENFLSAVSAWLRFAAIKPEIDDTKDHQSILNSLVTRLEEEQVKPSLEVVGNLVKALELYSNKNVLDYCSHDVDFFYFMCLKRNRKFIRRFLESGYLGSFK